MFVSKQCEYKKHNPAKTIKNLDYLLNYLFQATFNEDSIAKAISAKSSLL